MLGMSTRLWGSEVPPVVCAPILAQGHCILSLGFGNRYRAHANLDPILPVRAFDPCQGGPIEAQEQRRDFEPCKTRPAELSHCFHFSHPLFCNLAIISEVIFFL